MSISTELSIAGPSGIIANSGFDSLSGEYHRRRIAYLEQVYEKVLACGIARFSAIDAAVIVASRCGIPLEEKLIPAINGTAHLSRGQADTIAARFPEVAFSAINVWTAAAQ